MTKNQHFTPALGKAQHTGDYDRVIAVMTREQKWRGLLLRSLAPETGETIIDLGSGSGSLAIMIAQAAQNIRVIAVDPDPEVRAIAEAKAEAAQTEIKFITALGGDQTIELPYGTADKVVTSLVLHQCTMEAKQALLANAMALLRPSGTLYVADYGVQKTLLMQLLFNQVRSLDGYENTRANKDGMIPLLISQAGFAFVAEHWTVQTPTGSITLWTGRKPSL